MSLDDLENIKNEISCQSPATPVEPGLDSEIPFNCHKGIFRFNACCRNIDIMQLPYGIIRLKQPMNPTSSELGSIYTLS